MKYRHRNGVRKIIIHKKSTILNKQYAAAESDIFKLIKQNKK